MVSVILPAYNRAATLPRAIKSVLAQYYADWELVIVDDGSTDNTLAVATPFLGARVRYFNTENFGVSHARNFGVKNSSGEWIAFIDSDDEWLPRKLELQMALTPYFELIHGEENWFRNDKPVKPQAKHAKSGGDVFKRCIEICCISPSTTVISRWLFEKMHGFREDFPVCEDYELWLRITRDLQVGFINEPVQNKYAGSGDQLSFTTPAMDYFRLKALAPFLESREAETVAHNMLVKADILLNGFKKYPNRKRELEVADWRQSALNVLKQSQSTHSAAERLPRSLDNETL